MNVQRRVAHRLRLRDRTEAPIGAGSYTPGVVLLVGEQVNRPEESANHTPFCAPGGCSSWLNAQLEKARIPESQLFWVNALDNDGSEVDLRRIYEEIKPREVIALGRVAEHQLRKFGVEHAPFPHPQSWKRFRHFQPYPLIPVLKTLTRRPPCVKPTE